MSQQLIDAVISNDLNKVEELISQNVDVNYIGQGNIKPIKTSSNIASVTALSMAVHLGHIEIIKKLLQNNAKIDPLEHKHKNFDLLTNSTHAACVALISNFNENMLDIYYQLFTKLNMQFAVNKLDLATFIKRNNRDFLKVITLHLMSLNGSQISISFNMKEIKLGKEDMVSLLKHHVIDEAISRNLLCNIEFMEKRKYLTHEIAIEMVELVNKRMKQSVHDADANINLKFLIGKLALFTSQPSQKSKAKLIGMLEKIDTQKIADAANPKSVYDETKGRLNLFQARLTNDERDKFVQEVKPVIKSFIRRT